MTTSLAIMSGSFLEGILWDKFGSFVPFIISLIVSLLVASLLYFVKERKG